MCSGLVVEAIGDLLAANHQKLLIRAQQRVQPVNAGEKVVIGEDDELIAVLAVPANHFVRRRISVAVERMCVGVALEPLTWRRGLIVRRACFQRGLKGRFEGTHNQRRGTRRCDDPVKSSLLQDVRRGAQHSLFV